MLLNRRKKRGKFFSLTRFTFEFSFVLWNWCLYLHIDKRQAHKSRSDDIVHLQFFVTIFVFLIFFFLNQKHSSWSIFQKIAWELRAKLQIVWSEIGMEQWTAPQVTYKTKRKQKSKRPRAKKKKSIFSKWMKNRLFILSISVKVFTVLKTRRIQRLKSICFHLVFHLFRLRVNKADCVSGEFHARTDQFFCCEWKKWS